MSRALLALKAAPPAETRSNMAYKGVKAQVPGKPGKTETKFPIHSKNQAADAMARMNQAKPPLTGPQKHRVASAAMRAIGHSTPAIKRILGSTK